jgi:hypothetical protein
MSTSDPFASLLFTKNWQSYAFLQSGVQWRLEGDDQKARHMFLRALRQDPNSRGALLNLGILHMEAKRYEWALRSLERARQEARKIPDFQIGPVWYKSTYQIAATYTYKGELTKAESEVGKLTDKIHDVLELQHLLRFQRTPDKTLKEFLGSMHQLAEILHAGIWIGQGKIRDAKHKVCKLQDDGDLSYRARYNLGCFYSRLSKTERKETPGRRKTYSKALENLQYAFEHDGTLTRWASKDPALKPLREDDKTKAPDDKTAKEAFEELCEMYAPPAKPKAADGLPLASVAIIGETYAKQLKERGIAKEDDLLLKANTAAAQEALADQLGIDVKLVRRWALLTDLMRIVGIDTPHANLLDAAGVGSLKDLRDSNPEELARRLHQINRARSLVPEAPSVESVRQWISEAKDTTPKVSGLQSRWWHRLLPRGAVRR